MSLLATQAGTWVCELVKGVTPPLACFCWKLVHCKLSLVFLLEKNRPKYFLRESLHKFSN